MTLMSERASGNAAIVACNESNAAETELVDLRSAAVAAIKAFNDRLGNFVTLRQKAIATLRANGLTSTGIADDHEKDSLFDPIPDPDAAPPPAAAPPPDGERWAAVQDRVAKALVMMPPVSTLVVTHGGAIRAALADLCGFDRRQIWAFDVSYAALVSLRVWQGPTRTVQIVGLAT